MKKYSIIYADPPWRYDRAKVQGAAETHYSTMSVEDICGLNVSELADKDCVLFLWATFPKLPEALQVIEAWGFQYKSVAFVWLKQNKSGKGWFYGLGFWTRGNAEICLLATKGKPHRQSNRVHQFIISPLREHSQKPDEAREKILELMGDLLGVAAFCGFHIYEHYAQVNEQTEAFEQIAEVVEQAPENEPVSDDTPVSEGEDVLSQYRELYLQNEDMVGWISIAGTTINYPVMQTKNNPNFYLKHNFEKEYSDLGVPYIQENCDILNSDNLIIYGHHIKGGKMFGALEDYKSKSFYEEHKTIQFDTLTEAAEYEIVAVFKTVAYSAEGYRYYDFVNAETEEAFEDYISKCREFALYDTGVSAEYGDKLITLSTCEYSAQNGRLVVVAKKMV